MKLLVKKFILSFVFCIYCFNLNAQDIAINGGFLYTTWPDSLGIMPSIISLIPQRPAEKNRKPLQLLFIIDISQASEGDILPNVKQGIKNAIKSLDNEDMLCIMTYSNYPNILFPLQPLTTIQRRNAENILLRIKYEKDKNLSEALLKIPEQFSKFNANQSQCRAVFFLSDAPPIKGGTKNEDLLAIITKQSQDLEIIFNTIGFGKNCNEELLLSAAHSTGGKAYFIREENKAGLDNIFTKEIERLKSMLYSSIQLDLLIPSPATLSTDPLFFKKNNSFIFKNVADHDTIILFYALNKKPLKKKEISVQCTYTDAINGSTKKISKYFDIRSESSTLSLNSETAPLILEYTVYQQFLEISPLLEDNIKENRLSFIDQAKEIIIAFEMRMHTLPNAQSQFALSKMKRFLAEVENQTTDGIVLIKQIKYYLSQLTYKSHYPFLM